MKLLKDKRVVAAIGMLVLAVIESIASNEDNKKELSVSNDAVSEPGYEVEE